MILSEIDDSMNSPIDEQLSIGDKSMVKSIRERIDAASPFRGRKKSAMGGENPVERILCIPRSLERSDTRGIKLTGRERWSFNGGDINLTHDIISSSPDDERKLIANEFFITVLRRSLFFFSFLFFFRNHREHATNYITTFPYILFTQESKIKLKFQLTNRSIWKKRKQEKNIRKIYIYIYLVIDRFPKNLPKLKLIHRP